MEKIESLLDLLQLERIEENIYRGQSNPTPWGRVFGGQVLAQALHAAYETVPKGRFAHSLHGYFILTGDISMPIVYNVDPVRDGGSFTTRRVSAIQKGKPIFNSACSFQEAEELGLSHQIPMPNVPMPEAIVNDELAYEALKEKAPKIYEAIYHPRPVEFRTVERLDLLNPRKDQPHRHIWFRSKGELPDDLRVHQEVLAYSSDYNLLTTASLPHLEDIPWFNLFFASIDHAIWFHRPFRADEWLLFALDSPSASGGRGFTRGNVFTRDGLLVASVVQEGLMRPRK